MILIAIGANLAAGSRTPQQTCEAALAALPAHGVNVLRRSRWFKSDAQPPSGQPPFINGVAEVQTALAPPALLAVLHLVEAQFGRVRNERNEARTLDLDLLDYDGLVIEGPPLLPHPRMTARAFVLRPLAELAPNWRHPVTGHSAAELNAQITEDQGVRALEPAPAAPTPGGNGAGVEPVDQTP